MKKNMELIDFNAPGVDKGMIEAPLQQKLISSTAYTIRDADHFHELVLPCGGDTVVTIPNVATIASDKEITLAIRREGAAMLTIVAQSGVNLAMPADVALPLRLPVPGNVAILNRTGLNDWQIYGDFALTTDA